MEIQALWPTQIDLGPATSTETQSFIPAVKVLPEPVAS